MTTDRELLELAAKAAGYDLPSADDHDEIGRQYEYHLGLWVKYPWWWGWFRPHIDDGQALRLAVKLRLVVDIDEEAGEAWVRKPWYADCEVAEPFGEDPFAATRRAIVRAAADIGKSMP